MTDAVIAAARLHWGLGDAPITLVAARENAVFRVDRPRGPAALRLHRPGYRSEAELRSELNWMAMLHQNGITVPEPIPAGDGSLLMVNGGIAVDLLSWLEGAPLSDGTVPPETYRRLGCLIAEMHDCADAWTPPPDFARPTWDLIGDQPTWGRFWDNPALTPPQRALFLTFRDRARRGINTLKNPDFGLIHADLVSENVLQHANTLMPIDFDDGGFGYRLFDLATVTFRSRRTDPTGASADATVAGYCAARNLDIEALPLFEAMRACTYVGWNITRMDEPNGKARNTRFIHAAEVCVTAFLSD